MTTISVEYINANLVSGSEELRTQLEQSWEYVETDDGTVFEFNGNIDFDGGITYFLKSVEANTDLAEEVFDENINKSYKLPIRLIGNPDYFPLDRDWKTYVGTVYTTNVNNDFYVSCELPYGNYDAAVLSEYDDIGYKTIKINPVYNYHLKEYQTYTNQFSETSIPNIYLFQIQKEIEDGQSQALGLLTTETLPEVFNNYFTLENEIETIMPELEDFSVTKLMSSVAHQMLPPVESLYGMEDPDETVSGDEYMIDKGYYLRSYLSSSLPRANYSGSTIGAINGASISVVFDKLATNNLLKNDAEVLTNRNLFPYYINIEMPVNYVPNNYDASQTTIFRTILNDNNFVEKFMVELKRSFGGTGSFIVPLIIPHTVVRNASYNSGSAYGSLISNINTTSGETYRSVSFLSFMTNIYNNNLTPPPSSKPFIMRPPDYNLRSAIDNHAAYKYNNTKNTINIIRDTLKYLDENKPTIESLQDLYDLAQTSKYYEVLAYRIEKTDLVGNAISNFWIYNSEDLEDTLSLTDSQVKYGKEYQYTVYMYKLIVGIKYKMSDLVVSKQIASPSAIDDTEAEFSYCLQFLDETGASADQLYSTENSLSDYNSLAGVVGNSVIKSDEPYLADFMINYEPLIRIVEIPMYTKTVSMLDSPASTLNVIPFQLLNNSQTIGFQINYESFSKTSMPAPINELDMVYATQYRRNNDMMYYDKATLPSRSRAIEIQVYLLDEKPKSYADFSEALLTGHNLAIGEKGSLGAINHYSKIKLNQKFYFIFRAINALNVAGPPTNIYEVELVSDGNYNYLKTNIIFPSEFNENNYTNPSKSFKKIFNIIPTPVQAQIVTDNADFNQPAYTQLDNVEIGNTDLEDSIWGKTFKIRLTSKKTGKKIDLNITYNVTDG